MKLSEFESTLNKWAQAQIPFLFLIDFEMENPQVWPINEVPNDILFSINGFSNAPFQQRKFFFDSKKLNAHAVSIEEYTRQFELVKKHILKGDSYLANLTIKTPIELGRSLDEIFYCANANYKFLWKDKFLVFSPEPFVQIADGKIFSFPMKGTINASISNAEHILLHDLKETAEHITIVDLIRNDLSAVASHVEVKRFRYIEKINTSKATLLQASSEVVGILPAEYTSKMGSLLISLLPAGSISGAPKKATLEILKNAEQEKRGFYTGIFGYFDGTNLDSSVLIRFIEQQGDCFFYRSGGGITSQSDLKKEYQEALDKIYVPVY